MRGRMRGTGKYRGGRGVGLGRAGLEGKEDEEEETGRKERRIQEEPGKRNGIKGRGGRVEEEERKVRGGYKRYR